MDLYQDSCPGCGGNLFGDGFTEVVHCEFADDEIYLYVEPDADPVYRAYAEDDHES